MLGPLARSRAAVGAGVLLTACAGSVVLASGPGSATVPVAGTTRTYGPVAVAPPARPLVDLHGPLLQVPPRARLAAVPPRPGPSARATAEVGPPGVIGPGSPLRQVRQVQRLLNARGAQLRVDGAWGPATTRAVEAVQAAAGLPVDGRVGPRTLALLRG